MSTPTPQHYEPWHLEDTCPTISISENVENGKRCIIVSDAGAKPSALQRAVDCVNACVGIQDPAAAIRAARDAIMVCQHAPGCDWHTAIDCPPGKCDCGLAHAIDLLTSRNPTPATSAPPAKS